MADQQTEQQCKVCGSDIICDQKETGKYNVPEFQSVTGSAYGSQDLQQILFQRGKWLYMYYIQILWKEKEILYQF